MVNAQELLDQNYPKEKRSEIIELNIGNKELEGELDLGDFKNLEVLKCSNNKLTSLNVSNCEKLKELRCYHNQLTQLILLNNNLEKLNCRHNLLTDLNFNALSQRLTELNLSNNNFSTRDLSCFSRFTKLEDLWIGTRDQNKINQNLYNRFIDSLEPLKNLNKLKALSINNTDLNKGAEYLPKNLKKIGYSIKERPDCKLTEIVPLLEKFNDYGHCPNCKESNTSKNWCQPCFEKELKQDLGHLTGQELVEKFIERQRKKDEESDLKLIPYKEFTNIEYLALGGFSKIYKAKWEKKIKKQYWESGYVVLKSLNNSQDITFEFLLEIANTKSVDFSLDSSIVPCFGISQDPETKNYIMVMQYVEDGNLREYLRNNYSKLSWKDKLFKLWYIASGLKDIHDQNLIHRDLHSGNILNNSDNEGYLGSYITDLGLSKHVSMFQEEDKVFGVLPYVAPEVLEGKPYTKASDIYSFSIIAYEVLSSLPPYYDQEHNESLGVRICNGLRPAFKIKISSLLEDLINKCWNSDPKQRLGVGELEKKLETDIMKSKVKKTPNWLNKSKKQKNTIKPYPKKLDFPNMKFTKEQFILADQ